ncbi:MAG: cell division protein FtsZ [Thiomicrospira sp.]|nr:cell division protein FtsZ [Thiomicrospira sp.]
MSSMKFDLQEAKVTRQPGMPVIKVIGLGGGGGNAVDYMVRMKVEGVDFICANTDAQALAGSSVPVRIQIGANGLGAGADPERGRQAAEDDIDSIREQLRDADMVFITAGMGGGTGTGAAPVVAKVAREMGVLTVGVVSKPFSFERRTPAAEAGIEELAKHVDSLITVPNDKLLKVLGKDFILAKAFDHANEVLYGAVQGISELVTRPGIINVDFEDLRTVMSERGLAMMGVGTASGEERARKAAEKAIANPLLEDIAVAGARGILVNITGGLNFSLGEFYEVGEVIDQVADKDAIVIVGTSVDETMDDEIRVTVVATGLTGTSAQARKPEVVKPNLQAVQARAEAEQREHMDEVEKPTPMMPLESEVVRPKIAVNAGPQHTATSSNYLDIPAFLRRQAD